MENGMNSHIVILHTDSYEIYVFFLLLLLFFALALSHTTGHIPRMECHAAYQIHVRRHQHTITAAALSADCMQQNWITWMVLFEFNMPPGLCYICLKGLRYETCDLKLKTNNSISYTKWFGIDCLAVIFFFLRFSININYLWLNRVELKLTITSSGGVCYYYWDIWWTSGKQIYPATTSA